MNATKHLEQEELALFAMQLLSSQESAAIALHIDHCTDCRKELAAIQGDLAVYAHTVELQSPPALARERLLKQVAREKKLVPIDRPSSTEYVTRAEPIFRSGIYQEDDEQPRKSTVAKIFPWVGWAVAAGLAVTAGDLYNERNSLRNTVANEAGQMAQLTADAAAARQLMDTMTDATAMRVTLKDPKAAPVPQGRATYVADKGALVFLASNMEPLQMYKVYELWLIPADGRDPIPAGTFHPDSHGNASVIMPTLPKGVEAKAFGVTVEDEGGSTTPTLPIIMVGA
jgi:Anti-sigma-K factor rskA